MRHKKHLPNVQANRLVERGDETFCIIHNNGSPVLLWSPVYDERLFTERGIYILTENWVLIRVFYAKDVFYPVGWLLVWCTQHFGEPLFMDEFGL